MVSIRKAFLFGLVIWAIPFAVAMLILPIRESSRPLFESIMPVTGVLVTVFLAVIYFRDVEKEFVREGFLLGVLWFAISILIDLPLMLSSPVNMSLTEYLADIGLTYVAIPMITIGFGLVLASREAPGEPAS